MDDLSLHFAKFSLQIANLQGDKLEQTASSRSRPSRSSAELAVEHVLAVEQRARAIPLTAKPALSEFSTAQIKPRSLAFASSERNKLDRELHGPAGELSRQRQR
jgi:hypothetical protein